MDLSTTYMKMRLRTPLVASASPLSRDLENVRHLEDAGASAIVLYSLFEEQLHQESTELERRLAKGTESFPESLTYFPKSSELSTGPEGYLNHIVKAKKAVDVPIIASLNGASLGGWTQFAREVEQAGADAIECNIYFLPADMEMSAHEVEKTYTEIVRSVRDSVHIPIAVKLSPFFSNMAYMAKRLEEAGADGLVLFNRFYQPDIDLENLEIKPSVLLSTSRDSRLPLTWIGILYGRIRASLAATGGVHEAEDVIKLLMAGADVTMMCSSLLRKGISHLREVTRGLRDWMETHEYKSVHQMQGSMSQIHCADPGGFERAQYTQAVSSLRHVLVGNDNGEAWKRPDRG